MTLVIGHGGASAVAPANTLRSFAAALDAGVDMIEFDVRSRGGRLVLAHSFFPRTCLALDDALDHLGRPQYARVGLNVDIKVPGYERETLAALRSHGLSERALVSSQCPAVLDAVRRADPGVRTAISIAGPFAWRARNRSLGDWRVALVAAVRGGRFGAAMLQHSLIDARLVAAVARAGGTVYAWTVNERARFAELVDCGVAGVVTADPLLVTRERPADTMTAALAIV